MTPRELFAGADTLRVPGERRSLAFVLLTMPITLSVLGAFVHDQLTLHTLALLALGGMLLVSIGRGRLLGSSVRIHEQQFGHVFEVVAECAERLGIPAPSIFVRDDQFVPIHAIGLGEPYALVISSYWIEQFSDDELRFLAGRELAHIAAGHTRISSLLSVNGREHPIVGAVFGPWLRTIDFTADRIGLLLCGSIDVAFSAIAVATFRRVGRKIDIRSFAEQRREIDAEPLMQLGERLGSTPFATTRMARLGAFARTPLHAHWADRLAARQAQAPPVASGEGIYAAPWRRLAALALDLVLIGALLPTGEAIRLENVLAGLHGSIKTNGLIIPAYFAYGAAFVGLAGQTFGMMILDLRIVDTGLRRIGFGRAIWRYALFAASLLAIVGWPFVLKRIQPYERYSGTRVVSGSARPVDGIRTA